MRYSAFISYNHRDQRHAIWLHRALENYRVPKRLRGRESPLGPIAAKLPPVFRDRDELAASADLARAVTEALDESATLIIICSPNGAASRWVNEEIRHFIALGRRDRITCLVVDGQPGSGDPATDSFPPALLEGATGEPLAADIRPLADGKSGARLKVIAAMLGVPFDELRQREAQRRQRRLAVAASVMTVIAVAMGVLAVAAIVQRNIARERTVTAERTVDFVKSMFEVSDPSEARGATVTAREILDRGAAKIDRELVGEPAVRAELGLTLGEVYGSLGLFRQSDAIIRRTLAIPHGRPEIGAHQRAALGDSLFRLGDYEKAIIAYRRAADLARDAGDDRARLLPRALVGLGQSLSAIDDTAAAGPPLREALKLDIAQRGAGDRDVARDLEALGLNAVAARKFEEARPFIERALAIRLQTEGPLSPSVADNNNTLGSIAYNEGDLPTATRYYRANVAAYERVLGPNHPDVAGALNNYALVLLDRRRFAEAEPLLARALAINLAQRGAEHDDLTYIYSNLARAKLGLGKVVEAEALMTKALTAARANKHRLLGPIMADLAGLRCQLGQTREGFALLDEATPIVRETFPNDPWRAAWVETMRGNCLIRADRTAEAAAILKTSVPIVAKRWPADTLYGHIAALLAARIAGVTAR